MIQSLNQTTKWDLHGTWHGLMNDEVRNITKLEAQWWCSGVLKLLCSNSPSLCLAMKDTWCRQAQECLENLTARFAICWALRKQDMKMAMQRMFDAANHFQMESRWRNNEGGSRVFGGLCRKISNAKNAKCEVESIFSVAAITRVYKWAEILLYTSVLQGLIKW